MKLLAWLGGAVFVGSLALCTWWYVIWLGRDATGGGWQAVVVDGLLITLFACHHSVLARESVKRRLRIIPSPMMRSSYVWVASLLLVLVIRLWAPVGGEIYDVSGLPAVGHAAVQLFGVWLIARAVAGLDPLELAGIRQVIGRQPRQSFEPPQPETPSTSLQVTGPYRWVRHPLYLGWMLALFGAAHMTGDRLAFAGWTSLYLVVGVRWEERSLERSVGERYSEYARRVRWRIIPYVY